MSSDEQIARTLDDMAPAERADCVGMWATYHGSTSPRPVIIWAVDGGMVWRLSFTARHAIMATGLDQITPRFDLPRAWTPSGEPVPGEWVGGSKPPTHTIPHQGGFNQIYRRFVTDWEEA